MQQDDRVASPGEAPAGGVAVPVEGGALRELCAYVNELRFGACGDDPYFWDAPRETPAEAAAAE